MKPASALTPSATRAMAKPRAAAAGVKDLSPEAKQQTALLMNDLFERLRSVCPGWKQAWSTDALYRKSKITWTEALMAAGMNDWALVERGLERCREEGHTFIPTPADFIAMCWLTPAEIGAPEEEAAYWEAQRNSHPSMIGHERWSHNAVFHATIQCSRHSLLKLPSDVGRLKFAKAYNDVIRRISLGEVLPEPAPALPADLGRKGDPIKARSALDALRATLNGAQP